jgi:hypothetical protein
MHSATVGTCRRKNRVWRGCLLYGFLLLGVRTFWVLEPTFQWHIPTSTSLGSPPHHVLTIDRSYATFPFRAFGMYYDDDLIQHATSHRKEGKPVHGCVPDCNLTCDKLSKVRLLTVLGPTVHYWHLRQGIYLTPHGPLRVIPLPLFSFYFLFGSHPSFASLHSFPRSLTSSAHSVFEPVVICRLRRGRAYYCSIATHHHPLSHRHHIMTIFSLIFEFLTGAMMFLSAPHLLDRVLARLCKQPLPCLYMCRPDEVLSGAS